MTKPIRKYGPSLSRLINSIYKLNNYKYPFGQFMQQVAIGLPNYQEYVWRAIFNAIDSSNFHLSGITNEADFNLLLSALEKRDINRLNFYAVNTYSIIEILEQSYATILR